ncbi:MAG: glycosyltransferase family 39 protein [Chloroflexi bacterium]|nr:glycosyltransferase family 39 protein [Chloroflexota bacterium]
MTGLVLALGALVIVTEPLGPTALATRWIAVYGLFVTVPGWLLTRGLLPPEAVTPPERILIALAAGYGLAILLGLALSSVFRPIVPWQITLGAVLLALGLAFWSGLSPRRFPAPTSHRTHPSTSSSSGFRPPTRPPLAPLNSQTSTLGSSAPRHSRLALLHSLRAQPLLLVALVAAPLRLFDLGWSEFQGDEARILLRAMAALQGEPGALAAHRKVPGEILLTYVFYGQLGAMTELVGRLPFALAGVLGVLAFAHLASILFGRPAGLIAGLLLAVNGYYVAFGRILQYDSLAFFLGTVGLLCCWRFGQAHVGHVEVVRSAVRTLDDAAALPEGNAERVVPSRLASPPDRSTESADLNDWPGVVGGWMGRPETLHVAWAVLGALTLASAVLVALGAVFFLPPALLLVAPAFSARRRLSARTLLVWAIAWGWPLLPAVLAAALIFTGGDSPGGPSGGPSGVWSYLGPRLGGERPYWNADAFLRSANHYLSTPYLLVTVLAGAATVLLGLVDRLRAGRARVAAVQVGLALLIAGVAWGQPGVAATLGALVVLTLLILAPGQPLGRRVGLAWLAGPLLVHLLLIRFPGTHFREAFPGLVLLTGGLLAPLLTSVRASGRAANWRALSRGVVTSGLVVLVLGSAHFGWVSYMQRWPEYQITYPQDRHPLDWSGTDGRGIGGVFGLVHAHGWKALGVLAANGVLPGGYATNESPAIAAWYVRQPQGCPGSLAYVFRAPRTPQDRNLAGPVPLPTGYVDGAWITVDGHRTIAIQMPPNAARHQIALDAVPLAEQFDRDLTSPWRPIGNLYQPDLGAATARRACAQPPSASDVKQDQSADTSTDTKYLNRISVFESR